LTKKKTKAAPAKAPPPFDPHNVSGKKLGEVLGLTARQVANLYHQRTFKQNGKRGRYDIFECVPQYVQSIKTSGTAEAGELLKIAQRKKIEHQNEVSAGLHVPVEVVGDMFAASASGFLGAWRTIPRRLSGKLATLSSPKACRELIEDESSKARLELFAPIRKFYIERGKALPDILKTIADTGEAPAPKPGSVGKRKPRVAKRKRRTRPVAK
jgi:hypothetical protein